MGQKIMMTLKEPSTSHRQATMLRAALTTHIIPPNNEGDQQENQILSQSFRVANYMEKV